MKVTLVYAGITGKGFNSVNQGMDSGWISHALCMVGAYAKNHGYDVDLIDLRALRDWDHFREELTIRKPDVTGFTMMSVDFDPVMRCIDIVKEINPNTSTVIGGPHPTVALHELLSYKQIDYIVTHEGEVSFKELLDKLARGEKPPRVIAGKKPDLDTIPYADRDLFLQEWRKAGYTLNSPELPFGDLPAPFVTIIAARGCIYNCSFCQPAERNVFGGKVRERSVASVIDELKHLRDKYGFKSLLIHDDCLTENRKWVIQFCEAYKANGFTQPFYCQGRADIIVRNPDMMKLMRDAGLEGMFIGFESGNDRILKFIRKGTTVEQNVEAGKICKKLGVRIWANYMVGIPTETREEVMDTVNMIRKIDPDFYSPSFYTPHPGTDLYDYCEENDLSLVTEHAGYRRNPTEAKVKGIDYDFLNWAVAYSQQRTWQNRMRRNVQAAWKRYANPRKIVRKLGKMVGLVRPEPAASGA